MGAGAGPPDTGKPLRDRGEILPDMDGTLQVQGHYRPTVFSVNYSLRFNGVAREAPEAEELRPGPFVAIHSIGVFGAPVSAHYTIRLKTDSQSIPR